MKRAIRTTSASGLRKGRGGALIHCLSSNITKEVATTGPAGAPRVMVDVGENI